MLIKWSRWRRGLGSPHSVKKPINFRMMNRTSRNIHNALGTPFEKAYAPLPKVVLG
jgi:hypothetical protein